MIQSCENEKGGVVIQAGKTKCSVTFLNNGNTFITLNKTSIYSTICLGSISGYIVDKDSDDKLYLRTIAGGEVVTFFEKFPKVNFGAFAPDLLSDIGGIRERIKPRILELV